MDRQRQIIIGVGAGAAALVLAMTTAAMVPNPAHDAGRHMSALKVQGMTGFRLVDSTGADVGQVLLVEADAHGRTRYVRASLNGGEEVRIAAFRAHLNKANRSVDLTVPVAAVVTDPSALVAPAGDAKLVVASASTSASGN